MKLSVITINYNNLDGLRKTMESVFAQTNKDFEYIVIDGASTDGGAEYIKEHADKLTYWVSEKDSGIYNAMNKGVRAAKGEYVLMLNSGDFFVDEHVVERVLPELDGTDIVQGNILEVRNDDISTAIQNRGYGKSDIDWFDVMGGNFLHQASFCRKSLFEKFGYFDESYKMIADTKFFMTCLGFGNASYRYINIDVTNYDMTGISAVLSDKWYKLKKEESDRLWHEMYSHRQLDFYSINQKKIKLYDKLHRHRWVWYLVMILTRMSNRIYD